MATTSPSNSIISTENSDEKALHSDAAGSDIAIQVEEVEDSLAEEQSKPIRWIHIIFLPFSGWWQVLVMFSVVAKCIFGPMSSVFPFLQCSDVMEKNSFLLPIKYFYSYVADPLYGIDTFLYVVHRQVTEEAMKREHSPKSGGLFFLDVISLLPFFELAGGDRCFTSYALWPNLLQFNEFFIIYRIAYYFSLNVTHSYGQLVLGYAIMFFLVLNAINCTFVLFTLSGLCEHCDSNVTDWRQFTFSALKRENGNTDLYLYSASMVNAFITHYELDDTAPTTYVGIVLVLILIEAGYLLVMFILMPKLFAENILRCKALYSFQGRVTRVLDDAVRRNECPEKAYSLVEKFYSFMWMKQNGMTTIPRVIQELPRYLRLEIKVDLTWPVFYHSPTFRYTSMSYKRWLAQRIKIEYKLPGERFFFGPDCFSNLYYIRSGIVQFISVDDSTIPIVSVSGGTVFGDLSFLVPAFNRKVFVRCFTYCEIFTVSRLAVLRSLHKFPQDREHIMQLSMERLKHAKELYANKQRIRGLDRCEDEGIQWLKRRWRGVTNKVAQWKTGLSRAKRIINEEEEDYHCSKYIGQLVLCKEFQLLTKTMFYKITFPWILDPDSSFIKIWDKIIKVSVYLALLILPPTLVRTQIYEPMWFIAFSFILDLTYVADIFIILLTASHGKEHTEEHFMTRIFNRCKNIYFLLDLLSTPIFNIIVYFIPGDKDNLVNFHRLIKIYTLFFKKNKEPWNAYHLSQVYYNIALIHFCSVYITAYFMYLVIEEHPKLSVRFFYGRLCMKSVTDNSTKKCDVRKNGDYGIQTIVLSWLTALYIPDTGPSSFEDLYLASALITLYVILKIYLKMKYVSTLYLKDRYKASYQYFVTKIKGHYGKMRIHPDLLTRLDRYLNVHWKFHKGMDVVRPNELADQPYDIYCKLHGEIAEKVIGECPAFKGCGAPLVRALARAARFLIIPQRAIIYAFGVEVETVTWAVRGAVKCEVQSGDGQLLTMIVPSGELLAMVTVFFRLTALKTYSAASDCEILYIHWKTFHKIIKSYPEEWLRFQKCIMEMGEQFDNMHSEYIRKHKDYQKKLKTRIFHDRQSLISLKPIKSASKMRDCHFKIPEFLKEYRKDPESRFILCWLYVRAVACVIVLIAFGFQGGSGAIIYTALQNLVIICEIVFIIDVPLKLFLPYYDERGIVISDIKKCMFHYTSRGFLTDVVGILGSTSGVVKNVIGHEARRTERLIMTICQCLHLYMLFGCFNYYINRSSMNTVFIEIVKWQVLTITLALVLSFYYVWDCIYIEWNFSFGGGLAYVASINRTCWLPIYFDLDAHPTIQQLHLTFAQSLSMIQNSLMGVFMGQVYYNTDRIVQMLLFLSVSGFCWYQTCNILAKLILYHLGDTMAHHDINQLKEFLEEERVDKKVIDRAVDNFTYLLRRSPPINLKVLMYDRFSVVFRQDLYYYFYKKTLELMDSLIHVGKPLCRQLAGKCRLMYFLPDTEILRENQLSLELFIVHRGKVAVYKNDKKIATLTKGAIFGPVEGKMGHPSRISARTVEHADVLNISLQKFMDIMNDDVFQAIENQSTVINDYINLKRPATETAYNTIQYILKGKKTILLPKMHYPATAEDNRWYARWLLLSWVVGPIMSATLVLMLINVPPSYQTYVLAGLLVLDFQFLMYLVSEVFTMRLRVTDNNRCSYQYIGWKKIAEWWLILDVICLVLPIVMLVVNSYEYQLFRLLRLYTIYLYQWNFDGYQRRKELLLTKIALVLLLIHAFTCAWMTIACKMNSSRPHFPVHFYDAPPDKKGYFDPDLWASPMKQKYGCPRLTGQFRMRGIRNKRRAVSFIVPTTWHGNYLMALSYICTLQTNMDLDLAVPLTIGETYFKIFARYVLHLVEIWLCSIVISAVFTKFNQMYTYDFRVARLIMYLKQNGVCDFLLNAATIYTKLLWQKYKGSQLPEIANHAPLCLREDIFCALYIHHLQTPAVFQCLPMYFLRQIAIRLERTVIFPGKTIVKEGDIHACIYFIHEGEVEKSYTDCHGEQRLASVLTTSGYFGLRPGLFPDIPYHYSYCSRTVVDLIYLRHDKWQDLMNGYPDLKADLYNAAQKSKVVRKDDKIIQHGSRLKKATSRFNLAFQ